ncbi:MAG: polysaccharide biosynthesis/export family protein [Gemmatimonadetes bacterium]|nr:polysaccharide biosynthesis/export family protein [Gemmatimonadota bacterium]
MKTPRAALLAASFLFLLSARGAAQRTIDSDPTRVLVTRQQLQEQLNQLEQAAESGVYSSALRSRARHEAELIRTRLAEGDFQVGDRLVLAVEGERALGDTFTVEIGRVITLTNIGPIPLAGVLRSEAKDYLRERIARYIRDPVVSVRSLIRVSILGDVNRPGFYTIPTEALVEDVLMVAGGPARTAKLLAIRIERGEKEQVWEGQALQQAIAEGRTVDGLSLRAGDRFFVPREGRGADLQSWARTFTLVLAIPGAIYGLLRLF